MARKEQIQLSMNPGEYRIVVDVLNENRNKRIENEQSTDEIDSLIHKTANAPVKKVRIRGGGNMR